MKFNIQNEYSDLKSVLVHRPGNEINRILPSNMKQFLFDDIPYLELMQEEHDSFVELLKSKGANVFYIEKVLEDILKNKQWRKKLWTDILDDHDFNELLEAILSLNNIKKEIEIIFSGLTNQEASEELKMSLPSNKRFIIPPIPNSYFMRDPAIILKNEMIVSNAFYDVRHREMILSKYALSWLKDSSSLILYDAQENPKKSFTLEGGDVLVFNEDILFIGNSERTSSNAIMKVAKKVLEKKLFSQVFEISIPQIRSFMHLDTVFTMIDKDLCIYYPDVFSKSLEITRYTHSRKFKSEDVNVSTGFEKFIKKLNPKMTLLQTADGTDERHREQWNDGTNMVALSPRCVLTYRRNQATNNCLRKHGVEVIEVSGSELVRGRGGPRCMTLPICREND